MPFEASNWLSRGEGRDATLQDGRPGRGGRADLRGAVAGRLRGRPCRSAFEARRTRDLFETEARDFESAFERQRARSLRGGLAGWLVSACPARVAFERSSFEVTVGGAFEVASMRPSSEAVGAARSVGPSRRSVGLGDLPDAVGQAGGLARRTVCLGGMPGAARRSAELVGLGRSSWEGGRRGSLAGSRGGRADLRDGRLRARRSASARRGLRGWPTRSATFEVAFEMTAKARHAGFEGRTRGAGGLGGRSGLGGRLPSR